MGARAGRRRRRDRKTSPRKAVEAEEKPSCWPRKPSAPNAVVPALEDALRQAQNQANGRRTSVAQVQQQIQVLAADQRNIEEQSRYVAACA